MGRVTEWYYNGYFITLITTTEGTQKYKADIDGSLHNSLNTAKSHIDYLTK